MKSRVLAIALILITHVAAWAQVLGPSTEEVKFEYQADFVSEDGETDATEQARSHADYLFGVLHSTELTESFGMDWQQVGGVGSPHKDIFITAKAAPMDEGTFLIKYKARGKILLHKKAAKKLLSKGSLNLVLPYDLSQVYDKNCTDEHYDSEGDYWYFWNPYRQGCENLKVEPLTKKVAVKISAGTKVDQNAMARLDLVRGNNDNGEVFSIYAIHGFAEDPSKKDEGRVNFNQLNSYLVEQGFTKTVLRKSESRPLHLYTKQMQLANGKTIQVKVHHLLANTAIDQKTKTFAQFMREAVNQADVIFYAGHSGLGGNLDIPSLEDIAGKFEFNPKKKQIFYFDSCASYSYYLAPFAAVKTKAKVDVLTNGLSSYFHTSEATTNAFFDALLTEEVDLSWLQIMTSMEEPLSGGSYLLNVGGL